MDPLKLNLDVFFSWAYHSVTSCNFISDESAEFLKSQTKSTPHLKKKTTRKYLPQPSIFIANTTSADCQPQCNHNCCWYICSNNSTCPSTEWPTRQLWSIGWPIYKPVNFFCQSTGRRIAYWIFCHLVLSQVTRVDIISFTSSIDIEVVLFVTVNA